MNIAEKNLFNIKNVPATRYWLNRMGQKIRVQINNSRDWLEKSATE